MPIPRPVGPGPYLYRGIDRPVTEGTQRGRPMLKAYLKPQRASVSFGPRIDLNRFCDSRNDVETATNVLQNAVRDLMTAI